MLNVTRDNAAEPNGRTVEIDYGPPNGPCIRLTPSEWRQLIRWVHDHGDRA